MKPEAKTEAHPSVIGPPPVRPPILIPGPIRVSGDPDDPAAHMASDWMLVKIDGLTVTHAITADTEAGTVAYYPIDTAGALVVDPATETFLIREAVGQVQVYLRAEAPAWAYEACGLAFRN